MAEKNQFKPKTRFRFTKKIGPSKLYLMFPSNLVNKVKAWHKDVSSRGGIIGIFMKKQMDKLLAKKMDKGHPAYQYFSDQEKQIASEPLNYIPAGSEWMIIKQVKLVNADKQEPNKKDDSLTDFKDDDEQATNQELGTVDDMKGSKLYIVPPTSSIKPDAVVAVCYTHNVKGNLGPGSGIDITDMPDWMDKSVEKISDSNDEDGDNRYSPKELHDDLLKILGSNIELRFKDAEGKTQKVSLPQADFIKRVKLQITNELRASDAKKTTFEFKNLDKLGQGLPKSLFVDLTPIFKAIQIKSAGDLKSNISGSQTLFFLKSLEALESNGVVQVLSTGSASIPKKTQKTVEFKKPIEYFNASVENA